jgi:EAL domain-containing protein (putative c-di-GMP-specific phosphodiesterase class I)
MQVGASVGASVCPDDSVVADDLFTYADTAMYSAKFNSKDVVLYHSSMTDELVQRKKLESQLSEAVGNQEFSLMYQPQYNVCTDEIVGFEALVRWNRDGHVISPGEFIPILESSGQIIDASQWILDQVCCQLNRWKSDGIDTKVAINISPIQFKDPKFYSRIVETLNRHGVAADCLDLEITEGAIISDVTHTAETLGKLKSLGCVISVDDFGTGYSSLAYLKNFPIDKLKIDQTFIRDIPKHDDGTIANSIVILGLSLGLEVLAEGVETEEQLMFLKEHDCQYFQGYLGSKPLLPAECAKLFSPQQSVSSTS